MELPKSGELPVETLAGVFSSTTNSYKFYWFIGILKNIKADRQELRIEDVVIEMIVEAWYPINQFRLSFGKQDKLYDYILKLKTNLNCKIDSDKSVLRSALKNNFNQKPVNEIIQKLKKYVPTRFLTPWFKEELRGMDDYKKDKEIHRLASLYLDKKKPLYHFIDTYQVIQVTDEWKAYLKQHAGIIEGYILWNLTNYLQKNNPNVPNISYKLSPPESRDLSNARKFWRLYLSKVNEPRCIYSGFPLSSKTMSIDHFLPWTFATHDQLWNLVPTLKEINSSKGDSLPSIDSYLDNFSTLQYQGFHSSIEYPGLLEDYVILFKSTINEIKQTSESNFRKVIKDTIRPEIDIAKRMGFPTNWVYNDISI